MKESYEVLFVLCQQLRDQINRETYTPFPDLSKNWHIRMSEIKSAIIHQVEAIEDGE